MTPLASLGVVALILVGCSSASPSQAPTLIPTQILQTYTETEATSIVMTGASSTPSLVPTPNETQTTMYQVMIATQAVEQTFMPQFPHVCTENFISVEISPNGLWLAEECFIQNIQSPILVISNRETKSLWQLTLKDYMYSPRPDSLWYAAFIVAHWSDDGRYVYFASSPSIDGGDCYYVDTDADGLFRLDLQTGMVITILPLRENSEDYVFSFSPKGQKLAYETYTLGIKILDVKNRKSINVTPVSDYNFSGGFLWSANSSAVIYTTNLFDDLTGSNNYSLLLADTQSGSERLLLESTKNCLVARSWAADNIVTIESYGENLSRTLIEYDLGSNTIIRESTATPHP